MGATYVNASMTFAKFDVLLSLILPLPIKFVSSTYKEQSKYDNYIVHEIYKPPNVDISEPFIFETVSTDSFLHCHL